jgi:hypothetical protein
MRSRVTLSIVAVILLLASGNASGNVMGSASDGTFDHAPCVAPVQCSGQGTSTFSWGDTGSSLTFTGTKNFDYPRSKEVQLGTLRFFNTAVTAGTEVSSVVLTFSLGDVTATGADACNGCPFDTLYDFTTFILTLNINNTPNIPNDPVASRDQIIVAGVLQRLFQNGVLQDPQPANVTFSPNVFRVDEGFADSVNVDAEFDAVNLIGFGEVSDPAHGDVVSVPEPLTFALLGGGAVVLILARQRRSRGSGGKARVE